HPATAARIEVATVGVDRELALRVKALAELIRDAHLRSHAAAPRLAILIEPADALRYNASAAKRDGILRLPPRALHIELPRTARQEWRTLYTAILAEFLTEAATLPGLRQPRWFPSSPPRKCARPIAAPPRISAFPGPRSGRTRAAARRTPSASDCRAW